MSQANTILTEEELSLVNDCAARLRVIQGDAAGIDAQKRREYLSEEVNRSFQSLTSARRKPCLDSLLSRFPVGGRLAKNEPPAPVAPVVPVVETPEKLLERLLALAGDLPEAERIEYGRRLAEAGFLPPEPAAAKTEIAPEILARLGVPAGQPVEVDRVAHLAALVVQAVADLDRTAISVLKDLYPRAPFLSRSYDFRKAAAQYLSGDVEKIEPQLRITSALLGGMLAALVGGGKDFGRQYVEKFSPAAIEDIVIAEGPGGVMFGPNRKERCWNKYCKLSQDVATADLMDRWLKDCLGRFVDSGIKNVR